ncbi:BrnA antitoxin family protein [Marinivivus vitaminiproducens]|uniref:BrnA antitoxin family protein n=1 Tax=Marinivivus vitaminiproducens TaxID=3035935 RepID=UPI002798886F|nr:BrnA antitoxin family protein [Geminicoccaceae bacterium SCSIO 64248]
MAKDRDNPAWTTEDFAEAKPFKDTFPKAHREWKRLGRPPVENPKVHIGFRLAADVVEGVRATGKGYNARVEKVLREALAAGKL